MKATLTILVVLLVNISFAQTNPAYTLYNSKGKKVKYGKMMKQLRAADIVLFGEFHNNPISHWLQLEVTTELGQSRNLILGAEMVEADNQDELDAFLAGEIDYKALDSTVRLWPNHKTDYSPLVNYAKENELAFVASNVPRRFANLVYKKGFEALDTLTEEQKSWIAPLPIKFDPELPRYKEILEMMGAHGSPKLVMAQAIKDATMAYRILKSYKNGSLFIHYNGAFHSDFFEGILWYLQQERPGLNYKTISTVTQSSTKKLEAEHKGRADFIICVDEDMTPTY